MGIKGLAKLLADEAPESIRDVTLSSIHGRKIAVDASMAIYQFLIAVRHGSSGTNGGGVLTNSDGETTSHIQGLFNRTIRFLVEGIRPVYVFDGKPPNIKSHELTKRREKREAAKIALENAKEENDIQEQEKQSKRLVRVGRKENDDCKKLLSLMGVPVVTAPCEAEAQAAAMARDGLVWAVATEDMDALTFRTPILLRKMTFANASKTDIQQMNYFDAINSLELTHDQFVDLCILLGCDYCDSIRGVGPKTALKLIREHRNIETILKHIDRKKYGVPDSWIPNEPGDMKLKQSEQVETEVSVYNSDDDCKIKEKQNETKVNDDKSSIPIYVKARDLFNHHEVHDTLDLKWTACQSDELTKFLVDEMGFSSDRVKANIEKLQKAYKATAKPQTRMDSFFKPKSNTAIKSNKRKGLAPTKDPKKHKKLERM